MNTSMLPPANLDFSKEIAQLQMYESIRVDRSIEYLTFYSALDPYRKRPVYYPEYDDATEMYKIFEETLLGFHEHASKFPELYSSASSAEGIMDKLSALRRYGIQEHTDTTYLYRYVSYPSRLSDRDSKNLQEHTFVDPVDGVQEIRAAYHNLIYRERKIAHFFGYDTIQEALNIPYIHTLLKHHDFHEIQAFHEQHYPKIDSVISYLEFTTQYRFEAIQSLTPTQVDRLKGYIQRSLNKFVKHQVFQHVEELTELSPDAPLSWLTAARPDAHVLKEELEQYAKTMPLPESAIQPAERE